MDDFFTRALIAGSLLALVAGPLGCFVVWRRMAYLGDTIAHAALLGVALALLFSINMTLSVFVIAATIAVCMVFLQERATLSSDVILGILSHSTLAIGLVIVALLPWVVIDISTYLFGDILAVSRGDIFWIALIGLFVLGVLAFFWRPLLAATVNEELASAEGQNPQRTKLILMLLLALTVAIAIQLVGILLITALLVIPAASARRISFSPETMAIVAAVLGVLAVWGGLFSSLQFDIPSGPAIVVAALAIFGIIQLVPTASLHRLRNRAAQKEQEG